jgi:hypothetical protein
VRGWLVLLGLCGCNQAFNLDSTKLRDAPIQVPIDAPPPPVCPALGTVPRFSDDLRQIAPRMCEAYAVSENQIAMGFCNGKLVRGAADAEMTQEITLDPSFASDLPRLAPDGDHLFLSHLEYNPQTGNYSTSFNEFAWNGSGFDKQAGYKPPVDTTYGEGFEISTPSRGPDRHIVYGDYNYTMGKYELVEIADGKGAFTEVQRYPLESLGPDVYVLRQPSLSPDGLRMVFIGSQDYAYGGGPGPVETNTGKLSGADLGTGIGGGGCGYTNNVVMYADRATTADKFNPAMVLETVPDQVDWPYLTQDCGRIYVSALNRIFYFKQ